MARKKSYKPDSARQWRGRSYKSGGELVSNMLNQDADKADKPMTDIEDIADTELKDFYSKIARLVAANISKDDLIQFGSLLDGDSDFGFLDAINDEIEKVAPEVFGCPHPKNKEPYDDLAELAKDGKPFDEEAFANDDDGGEQ